MSGFDQGAHIVAMQNKMGLDVFVPGNHEFDFGPELAAARVRSLGVADITLPLVPARLAELVRGAEPPPPAGTGGGCCAP